MVLALLVDGGAHKIGDAHAGNLHGVLETEEQAFTGALVYRQVEDILVLEDNLAGGDGIFGVASDDTRQGALAVAVGTHDGMHLAAVDLQVHALQNLTVADAGMQIAYRE